MNRERSVPGTFATSQERGSTSALEVPAQVVDATQALNRSAGVANPRVLRGRSLSCRATLLSWACEYTDKSVPFGKYCRVWVVLKYLSAFRDSVFSKGR